MFPLDTSARNRSPAMRSHAMSAKCRQRKSDFPTTSARHRATTVLAVSAPRPARRTTPLATTGPEILTGNMTGITTGIVVSCSGLPLDGTTAPASPLLLYNSNKRKWRNLADAPDLGSGPARGGGSSPPFRTKGSVEDFLLLCFPHVE